MAASQSSPTALKRWIAGELTKLRERNGYSRADAAAAIHGSVQGMGHFENARRLPKPLELKTLLEFYGVPERADFFLSLRERAKKGRDWWIGFDTNNGALPEYFKLFLGLEAMAARIESWDVQVTPGLFQTRDYAEAIIRDGEPELSDDEVQRRLELRMARQQEVLEDGDQPSVWAVIDEAAVRRVVGGPTVHRDQLDHLLKLAERPNIDVQVLPFAAGAHTGTEGAFTLLTYPAEFEGDPGTVYAETRVRGIYYEEPEEVMNYRDVLTRLRVKACDQPDSLALINRIAKELS
ncbi:helix-turn-helix domain-containing protein [Haloactinomyces albus]|uniref:Transcriptional regulator with XRE-family HTH domain n=1 Tax=Haloactinomyces albus TaxID=1352928 RepID=A0AAE4CMX5_9ACTN|nr:helix-turn-helix transcriptional regulator [Haloactinomyces albus]MDR7303324.1 transcriptional regulator with XRE-family HTH domain [Haloactinomyces albus]